MTAEFNLGAMLSTPAASAENQVKQIPSDMLVPYHNHKFELYTGERLDDMIASIKENGVLIPIIVQPLNDKYEILIGHNRANASKLAGKLTVPAIIKEGLTDEEAEMYVIESNLMQRGFDNLKISEQAAVIGMRHSNMFSQGKRNDILLELQKLEKPEPSEPKTTAEKLKDEYGMSKDSIARLLRINTLIDGLKPLVDDKTLSVRAAVNISYLPQDIQEILIKFARIYRVDIKKSEQLRAYAKGQTLDQLTVVKILSGKIGRKPAAKTANIKISKSVYSKYFDDTATAEVISATIDKALEMYFQSLYYDAEK